MIGSLLYVASLIPDIIQVMGLVARFQASPKETHVQAVKIISKYMKGNLAYGIHEVVS